MNRTRRTRREQGGNAQEEVVSSEKAEAKPVLELPRRCETDIVKMAARSNTSSAAHRAQLEYEAALKKAAIDKELIDKKLAADIAHSYAGSIRSHTKRDKVEDWLEQNNTRAQSVCAPRRSPMHHAHDRDAVQNIAAQDECYKPLLTRLTVGKDLPVYSGDPVEWLQFKEAYHESTQLCNFSDSENLYRLRKCLRGEAKDTVASLLIGCTPPLEVLEALELRYGRPELIMAHLNKQVRKIAPLPSNYHNQLVNFSIKIKNYVAAVKAVKELDFLRSPEVLNNLLHKCPSPLITKWSDYVYMYDTSNRARLELFADFLHEEATKTAAAGVSYLDTQPQRTHYNIKKEENRNVCIIQDDTECIFCHTGTHKLPDCSRFKRALRRDRWRFVKQKKLCYRCIAATHSKETCQAQVCDVDGCGLPHHRLLHWKTKTPASASAVYSEKNGQYSESESKIQNETVAIINNPCCVLLKIVPINVHGPKGSVSTYALLDDGATVSLILSTLADSVGIAGRQATMRLRGAFNAELKCDCEIVDCTISNQNNIQFNLKARKIAELDLPLQKLSIVDKSKYSYLNKIDKLYCCKNVKPSLLIGQDNYHLIVPTKTILGNKNQPAATLTPLGWCVHGVVSAHSSVPRSDIAVSSIEDDVLVTTPAPYTHLDPDAELTKMVRDSFSFEALGIFSKPRENAEELRAVTVLEETSRLVDGRWEVGLPWKNNNIMPNSYSNAYKRLKSVEKKIFADKEYGDRYRERINHLFTNNYAHQVENAEPGNRTWYLPHFGVDNPNKKKLRVVFDAAAPSHGKNLNDFLLQGPDLLESLLGIMFKFREGPVALMGDIKDMFLCIKIRREDQDALRFLWRDGPSEQVRTFAMSSLIFGANCSPFIAQFVKNKNAQRFQEEMPEAVNAVLKSHYMDDYIDSVDDVTTAKQLVRDISTIHRRGGFEIRNWVSNVPGVLEETQYETRSVQFHVNNNQPERTLGLLWLPLVDTLSIDVSLKRIPSDILNFNRKPTKREMLRIIMSILDIYGFLSPITIKAKILMRETWKKDIKWDEELCEDLYLLFRAWIVQLNEVNNLKIPRWYFSQAACNTPDNVSASGITTLELHVFCDASTHAIACVAYWRATYCDDRVIISFIASKTRVAPIRKPVSVPRLELQAATLACRLANTIKNQHRIKPSATYYWTDSMTVLHWIRNDCRNYKIFVANRLGEIDELSNKNQWNYISTHKNIADIATKSCRYQLSDECEWFRGPNFLYEDSATWISEPETENVKLCEQDLEMVNTVSINGDHLPVPDPTRFSTWLRLKRSTARVLQFIEKCKKRPTELNAELLKKAEPILMKFSQMQSFPIEVELIKNNKNIHRDSRLRALTPFMDENGLLRVGGRINAAKNITDDVKQPVILDGRHPISRLIVKQYHENAAHGSTEMIVNELRQKYWIVGLRPTVRSVAAKCIQCRIRRAAPQPPRLGDLPEARVAHHFRPFTNCGLDLFGPIQVAIGRRREKRYGVLFTCLTVRAVHIELVHSLTADATIMAIRRMAAKRGWPKVLFSDNATNLRGAEAELKKSYLEVVNDKGIHEQLANRLVDWKFISPGTPHMGGAWERLIRSVKTALKIILKERAPQEETLLTLLAEVENMINSRPLTHVSVDHRDEEALTPNHFLLGSSSNLPLIGSFNDRDFRFRKQWRIAQRLANMFWSRWVKEVLPVLLPRKKWLDEAPTLKKGDIVLIMDPNAPRNSWPKGIIENTYPGQDGRIRVVDVKTKTGIFRRPVIKILLLPVSDECHGRDTGGEDVADTAPETQ